MGLAKNLFRLAVPRLIGFRPFRHLGPLASVMQKNAYRLRYLAWYNAQQIERCLIDTPAPLDHDNRFLLYEHLCRTRHLDRVPIRYLEFGVATGTTIRWWTDHNQHGDSRFVGFDTFHGLPEAWAHENEGAFSTGGQAPEMADPRCRFIRGLFQATLSAELPRLNGPNRTIVHLDADLYSSTLFVLMAVDALLEPGDILIFDEFAHVTDEFRAFHDYQAATGRRLAPLAAVNYGDVIAFETLPEA